MLRSGWWWRSFPAGGEMETRIKEQLSLLADRLIAQTYRLHA
jgi:hypothetical protein